MQPSGRHKRPRTLQASKSRFRNGIQNVRIWTDRHTVILVEIITPASADYEYRRDRLLKPPTDPYLPQRPRLLYIVLCVKEGSGSPNLMRRLGITYGRANVLTVMRTNLLSVTMGMREGRKKTEKIDVLLATKELKALNLRCVICLSLFHELLFWTGSSRDMCFYCLYNILHGTYYLFFCYEDYTRFISRYSSCPAS